MVFNFMDVIFDRTLVFRLKILRVFNFMKAWSVMKNTTV